VVEKTRKQLGDRLPVARGERRRLVEGPGEQDLARER
jgi:hypothetical protein